MSPMNGRSVPDRRKIAAAQRQPEPVWLTPEQVCARVPGLTVDTLASLREQRRGPAYYKASLRTVLYGRAEVDVWAKEMKERLRQEEATQ